MAWLRQPPGPADSPNGVLTVKGERKYKGDAQERAWLGRSYGAFSASYTLPHYVDLERVSAHLADGVLTIHAPKHERAKPKKISISLESSSTDAKRLGESSG